MKSKKGAEMTIGTIIVIILALVVLVVLIYGFSSGWGNLWEKLLGYGGGTVNVQTVVDGCKVACTTGATYDYCTKKSKIVFDNNKNSTRNKQEFTCQALEYQGVGLPVCDSIDCSGSTLIKTCSTWGGTTAAPGTCAANNAELALTGLVEQNLVCCVPKKTCAAWGGSWIDISGVCDPSKSYVAQETADKVLTAEDKNANPNQKCCMPQ